LIKSKETCPACLDPQKEKEHTCMRSIKSEDILKAIELTLDGFIFQ